MTNNCSGAKLVNGVNNVLNINKPAHLTTLNHILTFACLMPSIPIALKRINEENFKEFDTF